MSAQGLLVIHVIKNDRQEGPYPEEEVRRKILTGELAVTDLGWRAGLANWTSLGDLLEINALPASAPGPAPPPLPASVTSTTARPSAPVSTRAILALLVVPGLGLLGAFFDFSLGRAIQGKIDSLHSDISSVPWYWQLLLNWLYEQWGDHFIENAATVAHILVICGLIGGLTALLFFLRRYTKILAVLLIICGLAPLLSEYSRPLTFVGFPMTLGGFLGLFVRDKRRVGLGKA